MSVVKKATARSSAQWPCEAFHYILNSAEFPCRDPSRDCLLLPPLLPCEQCLLLEKPAYFGALNDSTVVSICVVLAGRLLNKGVGGDRQRKDQISQSGKKRTLICLSWLLLLTFLSCWFPFAFLQRSHIKISTCMHRHKHSLTVLKNRRLAERVQEVALINNILNVLYLKWLNMTRKVLRLFYN